MAISSRIFVTLAFALPMLGACELPTYESEHAVIHTDEVDQVCAGSLARVDETIEYIDDTLGFATDDEPTHIYVVSLDEVKRRCAGNLTGCAWDGEVTLRAGKVRGALVHELVHQRVERSWARGSKALFLEGIAEALGEAGHIPSEDHDPPSVAAMLDAELSPELGDIAYGYFYSGELVARLLDIHGAHEVLAFMDEVSWATPPEQLRAAYTAHFGTRIDDDLFIHERADDELHPISLGCLAPEVALDHERRRVHLEADLDCDSPRVENNWVFRDRVYVQWTLRVDEADSGLWAPVQRVPAGTLLTLQTCGRTEPQDHRWSHDHFNARQVEPGLYRVRWFGVMDDDARLDLELGGPCELDGDDCGADEYCAEPGVCRALT